MTTTAPAADARALGLAHYAARAVLESVLDRHGATFQQQITLRLVVVAGQPVEGEALVTQVVGALKVGPTEARGVITELGAKGLITVDESDVVRVTDAGRDFYTRVSAETGEISARIWGGIPAEDLAAAGRVLATVTERADAELAALSG
ncbi:MarR family transcriptional regulator [Streptomyces griseorubiginosus]|uniref:MarR family transcriptional regulator n=1 Tax=Streptomyces griseorubiginosus TaxID=67304 RepID=UPI001AD72713|nr:MarR family transcriptional regulator [Streptomyces griseorubiginosus]MBO4258140.1 MarR family transcriptional regulator [Streptomyces griseorubiginosus]